MKAQAGIAAAGAARRRWAWYGFDWASQPYGTLLATFIFAPYLQELLGDGSVAQAAWGYGVAAAGLLIAVIAPLLGGVADRAGPGVRMGFVWLFSAAYVAGSAALWTAAPDDFDLVITLVFFSVGLVGMEMATIFTNAMLPGLAPRETLGRVSGNGWAAGYAGGLVALAIVLCFLAENAATGRTLLGLEPAFGLDPETREGTRAVGPFTAIWYLVFMVPFFVVLRPRAAERSGGERIGRALRAAWPDLRAALATLPGRRSLAAFLGASMLYRDGLNGIYYFGGIYAAGVLEWSVVSVGIFGILALLAGAVAALIGGRADARHGPRPVLIASLLALIAVTAVAATISREAVLWVAVGPESRAPDLGFYLIGMVIGAAGGTLQAASRTMMVRQSDPARITQGFGLYALAGKATAFIAPFSVALVTDLTGSQQLGILPLLALFLGGLVLLGWVRPEGDSP